MAALYAGIYRRLKDKSSPLCDKLKLTRFAWKSDRVYIPNKEQVLIDFLCGLLLNRKRNHLSEEDVSEIWKCLCEILHSKQAHISRKYAKTLIIKPSIYQVLIDGLTGSLDRFNTKNDLSDVMGCCQAILKSPRLSYLFNSKYDNMVGLVSALTQLTVKYTTTSTEIPSNLYDLLSVSVQVYRGSQRAHSNQKQVLQQVTDKLFLPVVILWGLTRDNKDTELRSLSDTLLSTLEDGLFNRDHHASYGMYLSIICGEEETKSQPPKVIENLFTIITNCISGKRSSQLVTHPVLRGYLLKFLPVLFKSFLSHKCGDKITAHRLFLHICSVAGVKFIAGDCDTMLESDILGMMTSLLKIVQDMQVYSVVADNNSGSHMLKAYKGLLSLILNSNRSPESFCCLHELLSMNHLILEPKLMFILCYCCVEHTEGNTDISREVDRFLAEMITTYGKLHQVPKWIDKFIKTLIDTAVKLENFHWSIRFRDSFKEVTQTLPQTTTVEILEKLVNQAKEKFLPHLTQDQGDAELWCKKLSCLANLMHEYLMNIKVADYSVTDITMNKVKPMLKTMQTDIMIPLLDTCTDKKGIKPLYTTLLLCYSWGELDLLLGEYTKMESSYRASGKSAGVISHVHSYWAADKWAHLQEIITKDADGCSSFIWDLLIHQTMRAVILCPVLTEKERTPLIEDLIKKILSTSDTVHLSQKETWNGMIQNVTPRNYMLAKWNLMVEMLPVVSMYVTPDLTHSLANHLIQHAVKCTPLLTSREITPSSVMQKLLEGHILKQNCDVQIGLMSAVWKHSSDCVLPRTPSPKKKKKEPRTSLSKLFLMLADSQDFKNQSIESEHLEIARIFQKVLQADFTMTKDLCEQTQALLQVLSALPLEFMNTSQLLRCVIGVSALLHVLLGHPTSVSEEAVKQCVELLCIAMECSTKTPLFQVIDLSSYLNWLQNIYVEGSGSPRIELLLELSCKVMVNSSLNSLTSYLTQIKEKLMEQKARISDDRTQTLIVSLFLQELQQMWVKSERNKETQETSGELLKLLSTLTCDLISQVKTGEHPPPRTLVNSYTTIIKQYAVGDLLQEEVLQHFDFILQWSIDTLLNHTKDKSRDYIEALHFLSIVCVYHQHLPTVFTQQHKSNMWQVLMNLLSFIMGQSSAKHAKNQQYNNNLSESVAMETPMTNNEDCSPVKVVYLPGDILQTENEVILNSRGQDFKGGNWRTIKREIMFSGSEDTQYTRVVFLQLQNVLAALIASCDTEHFQSIVRSLVQETHIEHIYLGLWRLQSVLFVWQQLLTFELSEGQGKVVVEAAKQLMTNFQILMQQIECINEDSLVSGVAVPVLQTQVKMLEYGKVLMSPQTALLALHSCQLAPLDGSTYVQAFHAIYEVLNALLVNHPNTVYGAIPSFLSCTKRLLRCLILNGSQDDLSQNEKATENLIGCAVLFDRLCQLVSTHKVDFGKVAVYMVADYVSLVQQVTLLPAVKRAMVPAIYKWLDLCDQFSIAQLHTVLNQGVKDVFKILYADYTKYFKYKGKH